MNNLLHKIPARYRPLLLPIATLLIIVGLSLTLGRYEVLNIIDAKNAMDKLSQENKTLTAKAQVLSSQNQSQLTEEVKSAVEAIPVKSSTLPAIAAMRSFASQRNLDLTNFTVLSQGDSKKISSSTVEISAVVTGRREDILLFLNDLRNTAPLIQTSSVSIINLDDGVRANVKLLSYWSPLPETLGKPDQTVEALKKNEEEQIKNFQDLKRPEGGVLVPAKPQGKENPFSL